MTSVRNPPKRILGIDPGSIKTGYGVLEWSGPDLRFVDCGLIRPKSKGMPERLAEIFSGIQGVIQEFQPQFAAIEDVFLNKNFQSALKLGQARGVAMAAASLCGLSVGEYSPKEIKLAMVGKGSATKEQLQHMVMVLMNLPEVPQEDAADALGVAICHAHNLQTQQRLSRATQTAGARAGGRR